MIVIQVYIAAHNFHFLTLTMIVVFVFITTLERNVHKKNYSSLPKKNLHLLNSDCYLISI